MDWSVSSPRFTSLVANSQLLFVCPQLPLSLASLGPAAAAMSPTTASELPLDLRVRVCMHVCNGKILLLLFPPLLHIHAVRIGIPVLKSS